MDAYACTRCGLEAFPSFVLANSGKLIVECTRCQNQDPGLGPSDFTKGLAVSKTDGAVGWGGRQVTVTESTAARTPSVARTVQSTPARPVAPTAPGDVISWIEERTLWLATEEARLEGEAAGVRSQLATCRAERKRLQKMLSAGNPRRKLEKSEPVRHAELDN